MIHSDLHYVRSSAVGIVIFLLVTVTVYFPSLQNDFVNYDDPFYVTENNAVIDFDVIDLISRSFARNYHPLTMLSFAVEYALFGEAPWIHHLTNLLLHLGNSLLVLYLFWKLFPVSRAVGILGGVLFAVHPLHVESVAWISERKDVLSTFFFILSLIFYLKYLDHGSSSPTSGRMNRKNYIGSLLCFLLALFSKSMVVSLPIVLLLFDLKYGRKRIASILFEKIPFIDGM